MLPIAATIPKTSSQIFLSTPMRLIVPWSASSARNISTKPYQVKRGHFRASDTTPAAAAPQTTFRPLYPPRTSQSSLPASELPPPLILNAASCHHPLLQMLQIARVLRAENPSACLGFQKTNLTFAGEALMQNYNPFEIWASRTRGAIILS